MAYFRLIEVHHKLLSQPLFPTELLTSMRVRAFFFSTRVPCDWIAFCPGVGGVGPRRSHPGSSAHESGEVHWPARVPKKPETLIRHYDGDGQGENY